MNGTIFALIVGIYSSIPSLDHKPHLFAVFFTKTECEVAAKHWEERTAERAQRSVAICVQREAASPLPTS